MNINHKRFNVKNNNKIKEKYTKYKIHRKNKKKMQKTPQKFPQYFKTLLTQICSSELNLQNISFSTIFESVLISQQQNFTIQSYLAQLQISESQQIDLIEFQFKKLRAIYRRFDGQIRKLQEVKQFIINDQEELKFQIFLSKDHVVITHLINMLQTTNFLIINDKEQFKKILTQQIISQSKQQQLKKQIEKFLIKDVKNFAKSNKNYKQQVIKIIVSRKKVIQDLSERLTFIDGKMLMDFLNSLYLQDQETPQAPQEKDKKQIQSQSEFCKRAIKVLNTQCTQFKKKFSDDQKMELAQQLYQHIQTLNKQSIINTLTNSELIYFSNVDNINNSILLQIYKLENIKQLKDNVFELSELRSEVIQMKQKSSTQQKNKPKIISTGRIPLVQSQKKQKKMQPLKAEKEDKSNTSSKVSSQASPVKSGNTSQIKSSNPQKQTSRQTILKKQKQTNLLNEQIQKIKQQIKKSNCLQILLRQLEIKAIQQDNQGIKDISECLAKELTRYAMVDKVRILEDITQLTSSNDQRIIKVKHFKGEILPLNLVEIIQAKAEIENSTQCKDAQAVIIIGITGAGKSTFIVGGSGYKLVYVPETKDYRPSDSLVAKKFVVSNSMVSQTRKPNLSYINKDWVGSKIILIIDTPGLGENRSSQIDITNNMSTINMLNKLKSARIVIALTKHQFQGRCFQSIKLIIRNISTYLFKIDQFTDSITFIYSKGLTEYQVSSKLKEFFARQQYGNQKWSDNQKLFIDFLQELFVKTQIQQSQYPNEFQIVDPSKHDYKKLITKIIKNKKGTLCPGNSISSTFTQNTTIKLKQMSGYLQKMALKTFELSQFELTQYYLNQIKQVQSIQSTNTLYKKVQVLLKSQLQNKLKSCDLQLKKFYLDSCTQHIQLIKQTRQYFLTLQPFKALLQLLYKDSQTTPYQKLQKLITSKLKPFITSLKDASKIPKSQRKDAFLSLILIKELMSENDYILIKETIQNSNRQIQNDSLKILSSSGLKVGQKDWKSVVQLFINQFRLDGIVVSEMENYHNLNKIIIKYFDSQPQQYVSILKYLNQDAKESTMDGQLQIACDLFLDKLQKLKENYFIKQVVDPKFTQILKLLQNTDIYYKNQRQQSFLKLDMQKVDLWQIYQKNSKQILRILQKHNKSSSFTFRSQKTQQSTLHKIQSHLYQSISLFQREIDQLPLKPEKIDPVSINKFLCIIFGMMNFIKNRKIACQATQNKNKNHMEILSETMNKAEESLNKIKRKIQRTSSNTNIQAYALNYKLLLCLLVIKEFGIYYHRYFDQEKDELKPIADKIQQKLMKPLQQIKTIVVKRHYFQKLVKVLRYMYVLDEKSIQLGNQSNAFQFTISFQDNKDIQSILQKSFNSISQQSAEFQSLRNLMKFHQELAYTQTQQQLLKLQKQKQQNLNKLSLSLRENAAKYLFCYDQIKIIVGEFAQIGIVTDFKNQSLDNLDLQSDIFKRLQIINQITSEKLQSALLQRKDLLDINKEYKFLVDVIKRAETKDRTDKLIKFLGTQTQINQLILAISKDFQGQLSMVQQQLKSVTNNVDFRLLQKLLLLDDSRNQQHKRRLSILFTSISNQYEKLMTEMFINFDLTGKVTEKTNIFINIYQFLAIAKKTTFTIAIEEKLLQENCRNFFQQLKNSFDYLIKDLESGKPYDHSQVAYLSRFQRRILISLRQQYSLFLDQYQIKPSLLSWLNKKREQINVKIQKTYMSQNFSFDSNYKEIYANTSIQNKQRMKTVAIQKNKKEVVQLQHLLETNHQSLNKYLEQKLNQLQKIPQQMHQVYTIALSQIKQKQKIIQIQTKQKVEETLKTNNPNDFFQQLIKAQQVNSKSIMAITKTGIEKYYGEELKKVDFNELTKIQQVLNRQGTFVNDQRFQQVSKNDSFLTKAHEQFLAQIKSQAHKRNITFQKQLCTYKKLLSQSNPQTSFTLSKFKSISCPTQTISSTLSLYLSHNQTFIIQSTQLLTLLSQQIQQANAQLQTWNLKLKEFQERFQDKKQPIKKAQLVNVLREVSICKEIAMQYKNWDKTTQLSTKINKEQIQITNQAIKQIKNNLKDRYFYAKKWKVQEALTNDNIQRIILRNQQIQSDLTLLNDVSEIFFSKLDTQVPQNVLQSIQKQKQYQVRQFQQKVLYQIQFSFKNQQQPSTQRLIKFYTLQCLLQKTNLLIFPSNLKLNPQIKRSLLQSFKQSINKIEQFANNKQKQHVFKEFLKDYENVDKDMKQKIINKVKDIEERKDQADKANALELEIRLKTVAEDDPLKEENIQKIQKQLETDKLTKFNDFKTEQTTFQKEMKQWAIAEKERLIKQNNEFLKRQIALNLIVNRRVRTNFSCQQEIVRQPIKLQSLLTKIQTTYTKKIARHLYNCLRQYQSPYSHTLLQQQKIFSIFTKQQFMQQAKGKTFPQLLSEIPQITCDPSKQKIILLKFSQYTIKYNSILDSFTKALDFAQTKRSILDQTKRLGSQLAKEYQENKGSTADKHILLAYIFAIWTILRADKDQDGNNIYVYKPHDGQVLAVFLLLEMDCGRKKDISKAMVQVSTGQGKSVILAALSVFLALVGFQVFQACYSLYLSTRDYKDFQDLFKCLGLQNKIKYNIFPQLCKMMLDQSPELPFTNKVYKLIVDPTIWGQFQEYIKKILPQNKKNYILLIDEADVFLDEKYIGQNYLPSINIKKKTIKDLMDFVWSKKQLGQGNLKPAMITASDQFKSVIKQINNPIFQLIMQNQTHAMIRDLYSFKDDVYSVINDKIFYKQGDGLSDKIHFGYRTIFAYYHECLNTQRITINELNNQAVVNLTVAAFSYAKLPAYFNTILGVTGTLQAMSDGQKKILQDKFGVTKRFVQPSIYKESNRTVKFQRCYHNKLFAEIVKDIDKEHLANRPIVVFFKTKSDTYGFFQSKQFSRYRSIASIITYQVKQNDRDYRISVSTQAKKITLLTFDFSRGTDFKLKVKDPKTHPGLHVISAFLPTSFSDYIQLVGRTGRQGKNGSATIYIVQDTQVDKDRINVSRQQAQKSIRQKDNGYWQTKYSQINNKLLKANQQHDQFVSLFSSSSSIDTIFTKLKSLNHQIPLTFHKSKTAICIDATCSMQAVFDKVKQVIEGAMPDIYGAIDSSGISGSFEIKFVVYRNYDLDYTQLVQWSSFQNKSINLIQWLNGIAVNGGWGNQAVEVCLEHLNTLEQLNQFIIIADAKANTAKETKFKRNEEKGQAYWVQNGFKPTSYDAQLAKLINAKVKGHSYYLKTKDSNPQSFFDQLSKKTGGQSKQFVITANDATKKFADFVANKILQNLGQIIGGDAKAKLLESYANISSKKRYV